MSVIIKGNSAFDMSIVSNINGVESQHIKFQNIYFKCKSIEDAGGTIFVKRKTGEWISLDDFRGKYNDRGYKCSECSEHSDYEENFCPNCGADMRGEDG